MDQQELIMTFSQKTVRELLPYLYQIEDAIKAIEPYSTEVWSKRNSLNEANKLLDNTTNMAKFTKKLGLILVIVGGIIWVGGLIPTLITKLLSFFGGSMLIGGIISLFAHKSNKKKVQEYASYAENTKLYLELANKNLERVQAENAANLQYMSILCPPNCNTSHTMRTYVNLFETGQAFSLQQGKQLFAQYQHNQRMEDMAREQLYAARSAEAAAQEAANAARTAANNASEAARYARRTDYNTRFDD